MQQRGFTLIELIIVIVILGILAVTAAPRFIDLQGDARRAALQGVAAALQGGAQLVYAKAAIAGEQNAQASTVNVGNGSVVTDFGYPSGDSNTAATELPNWVEIDLTNDFTFHDDPTNGFAITQGTDPFRANNNNSDQCQVVYTSPTAIGGSINVVVEGDGC